MSQQTRQIFNIFFNVNCRSEYVIYLMESVLCKIHQYAQKAEAAFNLRLNNQRKHLHSSLQTFSGART